MEAEFRLALHDLRREQKKMKNGFQVNRDGSKYGYQLYIEKGKWKNKKKYRQIIYWLARGNGYQSC